MSCALGNDDTASNKNVVKAISSETNLLLRSQLASSWGEQDASVGWERIPEDLRRSLFDFEFDVIAMELVLSRVAASCWNGSTMVMVQVDLELWFHKCKPGVTESPADLMIKRARVFDLLSTTRRMLIHHRLPDFLSEVIISLPQTI